MQPKWLSWAKKLQSISQAGLEFSSDPYDRERYRMIRDLSIEILHDYTGIENKKIRELFAGESGYQTPKIDVRAAVFNSKDEILMVREKADGKWSLPGGWADIDLTLRGNLVKESLEEAGAEITPKRVIGIFDRNTWVHDNFPYSSYKIFVECDLVRNSFSPNTETSECGFYPLNNLPELSECRNTYTQVETCFRARKERCFEPLFD